MIERGGVTVHICYYVMKPSNAACFGPSTRMPMSKQNKHRIDKIASVFIQNYPAFIIQTMLLLAD